MKVTPAQIRYRAGMSSVELMRVRDLLGIKGRGSGHHIFYSPRQADVILTMWMLKRDIASFASDATGRSVGFSSQVYAGIAQQLLTTNVAVVSSTVLEFKVLLYTESWQHVTPPLRHTYSQEQDSCPRISGSTTSRQTST